MINGWIKSLNFKVQNCGLEKITKEMKWTKIAHEVLILKCIRSITRKMIEAKAW